MPKQEIASEQIRIKPSTRKKLKKRIAEIDVDMTFDGIINSLLEK